MGVYRYQDGLTADTTGVLRTADAARIPPDTRNKDWVAYQASGATPDAATAIVLADYKNGAHAETDRQAQEQLTMSLPEWSQRAPLSIFGLLKQVQEAVEIQSDGSPTNARYPMLHAVNGSSLTSAGTTVRAWWDSVKDRVGSVEKVRQDTHTAISAAANVGAVDTIMAALPAQWPA